MTPLYNLLIALGGFIIGIITFFEEIATKIPYLKNLKSLIFKIIFFIIGSIFIAIGVIGKDNETDIKHDDERKFYLAETNKLENNYRDEIKKNDSLNSLRIQRSIDSSYQKSIKASNDALGKYNLRLIDSLHSVASGINSASPLAQLIIDGVNNGRSPIYLISEKNEKILNFRLVSVNATAYNIRINAYIFDEKFNTILLQSIFDQGGYNFLVPGLERTFSVKLESFLYNYGEVLLIFLGQFSRDESGVKMTEFKDAYSFNIKENKLIIRRPTIDYRVIKQILEKNKVPYLK